MPASRLLPTLLATLVASLAFAASAQAQVPLAPQVPFDPQGSMAPSQHGGRLQSLDLDGDGMLSRSEAQSHARLAREFDSIDANRDGRLSRDELHAWRAAHPKGDKGEHAGVHRGFARFDTNGDGMIERNEIANDPRALSRFDAADANRDGVVTHEEARAARAARRGNATGG